ncbi:hypothetical protein AKJ16_DCAP12669 [Drosera capensis]
MDHLPPPEPAPTPAPAPATHPHPHPPHCLPCHWFLHFIRRLGSYCHRPTPPPA